MPDTDLYLSIVSVSPRVGWDTNVTVNPTLAIRFNQPVNLAQVQTDAALNRYVFMTRMRDNNPSLVTFQSWDAANRILSFGPSGSLIPGETYQVTVRKELQTAQGRQGISDRNWAFTVNAAPLGQVTLTLPADATAYTQPPSLVWNGVWIPSGTVSYDVQLDSSWQFSPTPVWTTTVTVSGSGGLLSANIAATLTGQAAYYWRVRARTGALVGEWSPTNSFWLGRSTQASPDTVELYRPQDSFSLVALLPPDQTPNQLAYPAILAAFTQPPSGATIHSGTFQLWSTPADQLANTPPVLDASSYGITGTVAQLIPATPIAVNTRYTVKLLTGIVSVSGGALPQAVSQSFTGHYQPLYGGILTTRNELGSFIDSVTDEEIIWRLWRASLYIHELLVTRIHRVRQRVQYSELVNYSPAIITWGMHRYAELHAACDMLDSYYFSLIQQAGRSTSLAVFQVTTETVVLKEIRDRLRLLEAERDRLAAEFLFEVVVPRAGIKTGNWIDHPGRYPPSRDWSYQKRSKF